NDQIQLPIYYPSISNIRNYNRETYNHINIGLSYAKALLPGKLSYGVSLYYLQDTASLSSSSLVQFKDKTYITQTYADSRMTRGFIPVFGLMYTPLDKLSFGASIRRIFVTSENRLINTFQADSIAGGTEGILFIEGTHKAFGGSIGDTVYKGPSYSGKIPEVTEIRLGTAIFPNRNFVGSFDIIHTTGYSRKTNNTELLYGGGVPTTITLSDKEDLELKRYATTNFALGLEYYLTEYLSIRLGSFTNYANSKNQSWLTSALIAANRELAGDSENLFNDGNTVVKYKLPTLRDNPRNEYVNNIGYTLGFSFSTAKASIGVNIIREFGRGHAKLDADRPNQPLLYDSTSVYVVVSSKNN
ncbi:MAG: transporter, Ompp1/FadL/TodX family protein, partial [Leptospiraceae bacterium]|nr:transporter, Ompp1/FadL/TodX family protein [Leptospiraceae bacterium]